MENDKSCEKHTGSIKSWTSQSILSSSFMTIYELVQLSHCSPLMRTHYLYNMGRLFLHFFLVQIDKQGAVARCDKISQHVNTLFLGPYVCTQPFPRLSRIIDSLPTKLQRKKKMNLYHYTNDFKISLLKVNEF